MRIAIMQPYFLPYAGYFRLFHETDLFVIYDCVQFTRRGFLHRNRFPDQNGNLEWLTLPLLKAPQDVLISTLAFAPDAQERMLSQQNKFPVFHQENYQDDYQQTMMQFSLPPVAYITQFLNVCCEKLKIPFNIAYSSQLQLPGDLKGQDRIIAIARHFNAKIYVNPPGGKDLYQESVFKSHDIQLKFLPDYMGSRESILSRLLQEDITLLSKEITKQGLK